MLNLKAQDNIWESHGTTIVLDVPGTIEALTWVNDTMFTELGHRFGDLVEWNMHLTAADVTAYYEKLIIEEYGEQPSPDAADEITGTRTWAHMLITKYKLK